MSVDDLMAGLRNRGWSFIPGSVAYQDSLADVVTDTRAAHQAFLQRKQKPVIHPSNLLTAL